MFLNIDKKNGESIAAIDARGQQITYSGLIEFSDHFYEKIGDRTLIFILSENTLGALAGYIASLNNKVVPLIINADLDQSLMLKLLDVYKPQFLWAPENSPIPSQMECYEQYSCYNYTLYRLLNPKPQLHPDLSLLLSTSGSTGSPKLVRHSYENVLSNSKNVAKFFDLSPKDKPVAILPLQYTMGLSLVSSHVYAGATILLSDQNLTDREFWNFIKINKATSFTGVPFSFEVLQKLRFFRMDLPDLELISQGGGKLNESLFHDIAVYAKEKNKRFIATYGQTEGTARMSFLPPDHALSKTGSIGKAIPGGELYLIDNDGNILTDNETQGELVYEGPNVTLGYASLLEDLAKGDENKGVLHTGDIARRDKEGFYYIVGRKNRFIKLYGIRYSLDELQQLIDRQFETTSHCTGNDTILKVFLTDASKVSEVEEYLIETIGLFNKSFKVYSVGEIPRNEYGKILLH